MNFKYIILSSLTVLMTIPSYSQSLKDLLEGEKKYVEEPTKEKTDSVSKPSVMASAVESDLAFKAVSPALKIVKQQYRLKKDGDFFGKNHKPHFGESLSLAVKVAGGTILQNEVLFPWVNDKDYQEANGAGKYTPVLYDTYQKPLNDGEFEKVDFELNSPYVKQVGKDSLLFIHSDMYSDFGLNVYSAPGEKKGYMLWIYEGDGKYDYKVETLDLEAKTDSTVVPMTPSDSSALLGGIYVIPVNERPGTVSFHLVGVASTYDNKDWSLKLLTKGDANINIIN